MLSARLTHSVKLIHIKNYECEAYSHLSYYCEAHSQLRYGCKAHSHLSYHCEAHSPLCYELSASLKHGITHMGKMGFTTKANVAVKVSRWVLHAQETERRRMVVCILVFTTYAVSRNSISDLIARVSIAHW